MLELANITLPDLRRLMHTEQSLKKDKNVSYYPIA